MKKAGMSKIAQDTYDVAVIGGGPAGMMAAGRAAELGANVIILEKNESLGKKLLITGGGRCNVTNNTPDTRAFLAKLKGKGKFLFSTFAQHAVTESLTFFNNRGMPTKEENEGRVFPVSDSARSVYDVLVNYMKAGKVKVAVDMNVKGFHARDGAIVGLNTDDGTIVAKSYILATGGTSHPETGSTGDGFAWLTKIGHTVVEPDSALVPVKIAEKWVRELSGVSHQHAKLTIIENGVRSESRIGRMVFAHFGISGPLVLNFSKDIRDSMEYNDKSNKVELSLDVMPDFNPTELDKKVVEIFMKNNNKKLKNAIREIVTPALSPALFTLSKLDPEKETNIVTREERLTLVKLLKDMRMTPTGFLGKERAIVASGGAKLEEIDFKTMRSRIFPNLYIIGDVLDVDRPSGGYSLQICWSTAWVAGTDAVKRKD